MTPQETTELLSFLFFVILTLSTIFTMLYIALTSLSRKSGELNKPLDPEKYKLCKLHKWIIRGVEDRKYMICSVCLMIPGQEQHLGIKDDQS